MAPGRCWSGWASRTGTATPGPARSSEGETSLHGLILLDLPDHDSVAAGAAVETDRLVGLADLMVWVLDPQKYADAAVHRRYLVPLAGHSVGHRGRAQPVRSAQPPRRPRTA